MNDKFLNTFKVCSTAVPSGEAVPCRSAPVDR